MLPIEEQVTNLELSKKLKELGVPQESLYIWFFGGIKRKARVVLDKMITNSDFNNWKCSAFTVAELGEMLPEDYCSVKQIDKGDFYWMCDKYENINKTVEWRAEADTEADTRAKMLIHLLENNLLKLDK